MTAWQFVAYVLERLPAALAMLGGFLAVCVLLAWPAALLDTRINERRVR